MVYQILAQGAHRSQALIQLDQAPGGKGCIGHWPHMPTQIQVPFFETGPIQWTHHFQRAHRHRTLPHETRQESWFFSEVTEVEPISWTPSLLQNVRPGYNGIARHGVLS
jgi:hypothetical protein